METIVKALSLYGLKYAQVLPAQKGYRNESHPVVLTKGETVNLLIYKREPGMLSVIKNANYTGNYAAGSGLPARRTVDERILKLDSLRGPRYAALYSYETGETIAWEAYTMDHIKALGKMQKRLHTCLSNLPQGNLTSVAEQSSSLNTRMKAYFSDQGVHNAARTKLGLSLDTTAFDSFAELFKLAAQLPNQQPLHMDFVRGNIIFQGKVITGIVDFEKTAFGHPYFDLARTLAFLLVDCKYKDEVKIRKYFLGSGYFKTSEGPHSIRINWSHDLLEELVNFYLVHDLYKFMRHNPYQNLADNEHYRRTRDLLLQRGVKMSYSPRSRSHNKASLGLVESAKVL